MENICKKIVQVYEKNKVQKYFSLEQVTDFENVKDRICFKLVNREKNAELLACFLQALFGKSCKIFLENVASPNWRKLQSLNWQLSCQLYSHCRPNIVVTA